MKQKAWTRLLALFLSITMVMTCLPLNAFAAGDDGEGGTQTILTPQQAEAEGYDVHCLSFPGDKSRYWTSSNTAYGIKLYQIDGEASEATASTSIALDTDGIDSGRGYVIIAPDKTKIGVMHNVNNVTAQCDHQNNTQGQVVHADNEGHVFVFTREDDGSWSIRSRAGTYLSLDASGNQRKFKDEKTAFYVTPAAEPNDGTYYIWTATAPDEDDAPVHTPQDATNEGYDVHYFGVTDGAFANDTTERTVSLLTTSKVAVTYPVKDRGYHLVSDGQIISAIYTSGSYKTAIVSEYSSTGNYSAAGYQFKLIETESGYGNCYKIQSINNSTYHMTHEMTVVSNANRYVLTEAGEEFFVTPAGSDGEYWIWYQTVSKTALAAKIAEADALNANGYTADSWANLQSALATANTVNADADATQDAVNDALAALTAAITELVENPAETDPPETEPVETDPPETSVRKPQDAIDEGYDVHYFIKSGGIAGKGWTFSDTADSVTIGTGGATTTPVTGAFDDATSYQIYVGPSSYLFAPYGTAKSTAQGTYDGGNTDFNIIANGDGTYKIKAEDNCFMTQEPSDFKLGTVNWKGVQFGADGDDFYITPVNTPNNGAYWIWYQTKRVTVDKSALAAEIAVAGTKSEADYTADSWANLQTALANANTVNADDNATQDQVDAALAALTGAIGALVEKPVEKQRYYFETSGNGPWKIGDGSGEANTVSDFDDKPDMPNVSAINDDGNYRAWAAGGFLNFELVNGEILAKQAKTGASSPCFHIKKQESNTYIISYTHSVNNTTTVYYLTAKNQDGRAVFSPNKADAVPYFIEATAEGAVTYRIYCVGPYTVSFNGEGSEGIAPISAMYGTTLPTPADREGYTFLGWYNGETKFTEVTADVTLTAKWEEISVDPDPVETIEHHAPTAGMVQHYLHYVSPGWGGPTTKSALELYNVANGAYTKDTDGVINSGVYGIHDTNPGDGGSQRWLHAGDGVTNQCGGQHSGNDTTHQFTFTYDAEKKAYTIKSVSTGNYLTQTASGNQLAMNSTPTYFYIDAVAGSAGSYYIWWETEAVLGDAISAMFDTSPDNTWVFTGGADVEGGYAQTQGRRNFMGHFEEYVRWQLASGSGTNENSEKGYNEPRQRYTINTAHTGLTLSDIVSDWNGYVEDYNPRAVVYMVGNEDADSQTFGNDLKSFIDKSLALRDGSGFAVVIKSYDSSLSDLNNTADTVIGGYAGKDKAHIVMVDAAGISAMDASGHYALGQKLAEATHGSSSNYPSTPYSSSTPKTYEEKPAPSAYSSTAPSVTWADGTMTITLAGSFTYEVRLDSGVTVSGSGTGSATVTDLPGNEDYTLVTRSQDGATQYKTLTGKVGGGAAGVEQNATQAAIASLMASETPLTWLFMGDSITHGAMWTSGYDSISQTFDKYLDMLGRPEDVVINTAVSSADTRSTMNAIEYRLNRYPAPDVVSIMLGTNDQGTLGNTATYTTNLTNIVKKIREKNADAVIILRAPTGNYASATDRKAYRDAMETFAAANDLLFIDQWTEFVEFGTTYSAWTTPPANGSSDNSKRLYFGNSLHPGALGQLTMAKMFIKAIGLWNEDTPIANLDYEWPNMTTENSTTSVENSLYSNENTLTLSVSALGSSLGQTTLTATNEAGQSWSVTAKAGVNPVLTLPDGSYTVTASSVKTNEAKTVNFAAAEVELPSVTEEPKLPAPEQPECSYEYQRASGEFTEGTYAIVGTSVMSGDNGRVRIMHLHVKDGTLTINHCQIASSETVDCDILSVSELCSDGTHLLNAVKSGDGYTFQVAAGNAKGKYLNGNGSTLSLSDTATVFTVSPLEGGGYNLSWTSNGSTYYIAWTGNFRTGSTTPYKLNLYRKTEVPLSMARTEFSGTSTDGPMNEDQTNSTFRIPALVTLDNGWIVAASDIRWPNTADSPNNLDTIVSVSKDGGTTWEWEIINYFSDFAPLHGVGQKVYSASFIDPAMAVDSDGTLWMAVDLQPAHVNLGQNAQKTGSGFDEKGYLMVGPISESEWETKVNTSLGRTEATRLQYQAYYEYRVDINSVDHTTDVTTTKNGKAVSLYPVFHKDTGANTGYYVDAFFDLYYDYGEGGIKPVLVAQKESSDYIQANLFYVQSPWKAYSTTYLMIRKATVNEETGKLDWGDPMLVSGVKNFDGETFLAFCPGRGTVTTYNNKERIIFPVYDNVNGEKSSVVYSDDGGKTWTRGARIPNGEASKTSESQIVVLPDGNGGTFLRIYCRNTDATISYADSYDGGATWSAGKLDSELKYGTNTMVSFINLEGFLVGPDGTVYDNLILASYPWGTKVSGENRRSNGVVRIGSFDPASKTVTWLNENEIRYEGRFNYSCVTQLLDENNKPTDGFGLLYEKDGGKGMLMIFHILTTKDLLGDDWNWVLEKPSEADIPTIEVTGITGSVNPHDEDLVDLNVDGEATVSVDFTPDSASVSWSSSDESVATVENGLIKAVKAGKALITAVVTNKGLTSKAVIEVVVQDGGNITLPERYANELSTSTVPAKTQYELDTDGDLSGVYAIFSQGNGARIMYNSTSKTDHCMASPANGVLSSISCHTTNLHLWNVAKQADGTYTIRGVSNNKYLTATASGTQLALGDSPVSFTITHQGNGTYYVSNGGSYLAWSNGWKMQSTAFNVQFFEQVSYEASESYTANADGLKAVIAALGKDEADYANTLALVATYNDKAEADEAQAKIDALTKLLYRELRGDEIPTHTHTPGAAVRENVVEATCTVDGHYDEVVYCTDECGEELSRETITVKAPGHTEQAIEGKDATCTETGLTAGVKCSVCGEILTEQEVIPATGHTVVIDEAVEATEASTGLTEGSHCSTCGKVLVAQRTIPMLEPAPETPESSGTPTATVTPIVIPSTPDTPDTPNNPDDPGEEIDDPETPLANLPFIDVDKDAWYAESIAYVYSKDIMPGMSDMIFEPKASLTRGMMAQIMHNMAENPKSDVGSIFSDLNGKYYTEAVTWGVANGVLKGYSEDTFGGEDDLTREQMAVMLYRYVQAQGLGSDVDVAALDSFADSDRISDWAKEAMAWAVENGLLKGRGNNDLDPRTNITRSEVAAVLERYLKMFLA